MANSASLRFFIFQIRVNVRALFFPVEVTFSVFMILSFNPPAPRLTFG
jgi:hypothetical protein